MATKTAYPLFDLYTIETLNELTGYSEDYLLGIKKGREMARPRFRLTMRAILNKSESVLFGTEE